MKTCSKCKTEKPLSDYQRTYQKGYPEQLRADCRMCVNKRDHSLKKRNPEIYEKERLAMYKARKKDPVRFMLYDAKVRSKKHRIPFEQDCVDLMLPEVCPVLGIPLIPADGCVSPGSPTLDKYIPELGYIKGNVNIISHKANTMKLNATTSEIELLVAWMKQKDNEHENRKQRTDSTDIRD